jgi:hypothetical protein
MGNPSPPPREKPGHRTSVRGAGNAGLLVVVALIGLALLVFTAWIVLHHSAPVPSDTTLDSAPTTPVAKKNEGARESVDVDLEKRIASEVERRRAPIRVTIPVLAPDGEPAGGVRFVVDAPYGQAGASVGRGEDSGPPLQLLVPGCWPELPQLFVQADGLAAAHRRRIVLPERAPDGVELEPLELSTGIRVSGRVLAPHGGPAPGVTVEAFPIDAEASGEAGARTVLGSTRTDANGEFKLDHLGARRVRLEAGGAQIDAANGVVAEVAAASRPVTIELRERARIAGRIVDSRGESIPLWTIRATMAGPEELSVDELSVTAHSDVPSDASGTFALDHLAPGYYVLSIEAGNFAPATIARVHTDVTDLRVTLNALASANVELLGAPMGMDVPVTWRGLAPGRGGEPERPVGAPRLAWLRDGRLSIRGIVPGALALELAVPGAMPVVTPVVEFAPDSATELGTFTLAAGATITASVRGPDGAPLAARVALAARHHSGLALARDVFDLPDHQEMVCGRDGRLEWSALPPGPRVLAFRQRGFADARVKVTIPESGTLALEPVVLEPAGALEGEVRTRGGAPVGEVEVTAARIGGATWSTTTDLDGRYRFPRLPPGRYELTILRSDEEGPLDGGAFLSPPKNVSKLVDVKVGEPVRLDVTYDPD